MKKKPDRMTFRLSDSIHTIAVGTALMEQIYAYMLLFSGNCPAVHGRVFFAKTEKIISSPIVP